MSNLCMIYPQTYEDARDAILSLLEESRRLLIGPYNDTFRNRCPVERFDIEPEEQKEGAEYSNLTLNLAYSVPSVGTNTSEFISVPQERRLRILCGLGDAHWTPKAKKDIWRDEYPSTVAVDLNTYEVFFFNLKAGIVELVRFGQLSDVQFNSMLEGLEDREPFAIYIKPKAMMAVITQDEGFNHLKRNMYIRFRCSVPVFLEAELAEEGEE